MAPALSEHPVLIVDDELPNLELLSRFLKQPANTCAPSAWFTAEFDARKLSAQMSALLDGPETKA